MIIKFNLTKKNINIILIKNNNIIFYVKKKKKEYNFIVNKLSEIIKFYNEKIYFQNYKFLGIMKKIILHFNGKKINKNT